MNGAVVERTAPSLLVENLHLEEHHVGTIGFCALGVTDGRQLELTGFSGGLELVAAAVRSYGFESAGLVVNVIKGEEVR